MMVPSSTKSSAPVTTTVCGVFQFADVKVRPETASVPSAVLLLLKGMVTLAVGLLVSAIVNDAVAPDSLVINPEVGVTVIPAVSLSVLLTLTSAGFIPL